MNTEHKAQRVENALVLHGRRGISMKHGFETWCGLPWEPGMKKASDHTEMTCHGCATAFNAMCRKAGC